MKRTSAEIDSGCIYISGAVEFDDRPGPVRDALGRLGQHLAGRHVPRRAAGPGPKGHLRADADAKQIAFEIHALILALHYEARFLRSPDSLARANAGFDNILAPQRAPTLQPAARPPRRRRAQDRALKARGRSLSFSFFFSSSFRRPHRCPPTPRPCATCSS